MSNAKCTKSGETHSTSSGHSRISETEILKHTTFLIDILILPAAGESLHRRKQATGVSRRFRNEDGFPRHLISLEILGDVSGLDRQGRNHTAPHLDEWPLSDQIRLRFSDSILQCLSTVRTRSAYWNDKD